MKDIYDVLSVDCLKVIPKTTKYSDRIAKNDLEEIKKYEIDIFIRLGFGILRGNILKAAKYGIWSFHHGDNKVNRGSPSGVWEVFENTHETGVILQILTENLDGGIMLNKSSSSTDEVSPNRNKNNTYWKALSFIPLQINELYNIGKEAFFQKVEELNKHPQFYSHRLYRTPTNRETFLLGSKLILRKIKFKIKRIFYFRQWILLFKLSNTDGISNSFFQFKKIIPPKDRLWADPHVIKRHDKYYIFIEEYIYENKKGHISLIIMDEDGNYEKPIKILEQNYHLSYPFIIEDKGELYMIPETAENHSIELYKCTNFPNEWTLEKVLMNHISAFDSTILFKDDTYWLFCNVISNTGASSQDELFLFSSKELVSDKWKSHPKNPIISDVKQSRPAGNFFTFKNKLYRPSQDSSKHYGYGMKINQVMELNENVYEEEVVDSIYAKWDKKLRSVHTINSVDKLTVIDALMKRMK